MELSRPPVNSEWIKLMEIRRKGITERAIFGSIGFWIAGQGQALSGADPLIYGRSLIKPFQMKAIARELGETLDWREKAIALASHNGTAVHIETAQRILPQHEWKFLTLPEAGPLGGGVGAGLRSVWHNPCSGKHSAILKACEINGWPMSGYMEQTHPYNRALVKVLEQRLEKSLQARTVATDGCLLPTISLRVSEMATLFGSLVKERDQDWIWKAHHVHPELIGGEGRLDTAILRQFPNILAKEGADGLLGLAVADEKRFPNGFGLVIKLAHGYDPTVTWHIASGLLSTLGYQMDVPPSPFSGQTAHMECLISDFQAACTTGS